MSDIVFASLITVGGMLATVLANIFYALHRDKRTRAETFFNNFFTVRLNAHQEILRTISKFSIDELNPNASNITEVQHILEEFAETIIKLCAEHRLVIDNTVYDSLGDLCLRTHITNKKIESPHSPVAQFCDAVYMFQREYREFIELLREKTGINIIDNEFANALKSLKNVIPNTNNKPRKNKRDKKTHPKKGV